MNQDGYQSRQNAGNFFSFDNRNRLTLNIRTYVRERVHACAGGGAESSEGAGGAVLTRLMMNSSATKTTGVLCHGLHLGLLTHVHRLRVHVHRLKVFGPDSQTLEDEEDKKKETQNKTLGQNRWRFSWRALPVSHRKRRSAR